MFGDEFFEPFLVDPQYPAFLYQEVSMCSSNPHGVVSATTTSIEETCIFVCITKRMLKKPAYIEGFLCRDRASVAYIEIPLY